MPRTDTFYHVRFNEPPERDNARKDFYFGSMRAIYDYFTPKQIGCNFGWLSRKGVSGGVPYVSRKATVTKEKIMRKRKGTEPGLALLKQRKEIENEE